MLVQWYGSGEFSWSSVGLCFLNVLKMVSTLVIVLVEVLCSPVIKLHTPGMSDVSCDRTDPVWKLNLVKFLFCGKF